MGWFLLVLILIYEIPNMRRVYRWIRKRFSKKPDPILLESDLKDLKKPGQTYCDRDQE